VLERGYKYTYNLKLFMAYNFIKKIKDGEFSLGEDLRQTGKDIKYVVAVGTILLGVGAIYWGLREHIYINTDLALDGLDFRRDMSKLNPDELKEYSHFQDLQKRFGLEADELLDILNRHSALSGIIFCAKRGYGREGYEESVKEKRDLIKTIVRRKYKIF